MTTLISKVLTVFVTIASVSFMAVVIANVSAGGPNWNAKAKELSEVTFEQANPQAPWTVKRRTDGADMGNGAILPAAIVSAQKKLLDEQRTIQADLDQKITMTNARIAEATALIAVDLDAMSRRAADLDKQFADLMEQMNQVSQNYTAEAKKQAEDLAILKLRSQEYIQIKNQLEELRAQREVTTEELARLRALVYQANANLDRAQTRLELLKSRGAGVGKPYDKKEDAPAAAQPQPEAENPQAEKKDAEKKEEAEKPE